MATQESQPSKSAADWPQCRSRAARALLLFAGFAWLFTRPSRLFDADSYLHLAIARLFSEQGFVSALPWARFSAIGRHWGDKEWLFHTALIPFVRFSEPELGGKLALALLCAALAWTLWELGTRAVGPYGACIPLLVFFGSGSFVLRALRLRPELLSLLLLLWVLWALAGQRHLLAACLAFAFALSHTAFHTLIGLTVGLACWTRWSERRFALRPILCVSAGMALALLVHPQFPDNLSIFWLQNVEFFRNRGALDVGEEFQPHPLFKLLQLDGPWLLGLAALVLARVPVASVEAGMLVRARRMATLCWVGALTFGAMFLQMGRFATLAVPFITLATLFELQARGLCIGPRVRLGGARSLPLAAALGVIGPLALLNGAGTAWVNWQLGRCFDPGYSAELAALAARLTPGARVAANWDDAELYAFYAPQARYLNLFDPVFMAVPEPRRYAAWMRVLRGDEPDSPSVLRELLESDYLALSAARHSALTARLAQDPRVNVLQRGRHMLFRIEPQHPSFIVGWTGARHASNRAYVDLTTALDANGCAVVTHELTATGPSTRLLELAAWGPSALTVDGSERVQLAAANQARLGQGPAVLLHLAQGPHNLRIRSCQHAGRAGFYLVDRSSR